MIRFNFSSPIALIVLAFLLVNPAFSQSAAEISRWEKQAKKVTIIRDNWGIPHVYGKQTRMLFSGCCMHSARMISKGWK
jgi:acyl-homoserine lactone acylase PvdQ